jgi:hypothetical protein
MYLIYVLQLQARLNVGDPVAEFIDPLQGDKVNSGIELSTLYQHAKLYMAGGPIWQPYVGVDFIP